MKNSPATGFVLTLCAAFLWGTAGTAQSFTHGTTSPYWIGAFRLLFACIFFHFLFFYVRLRALHVEPVEMKTGSARGLYWLCIIIAGTCMGFYNLLFFAGVKTTGIAVGTVTIIGSAPVWAGILQAIGTHKSPSLLWWSGTLCAIAGGVWMILAQAASWHIDITGLLVCLAAGFCYASYTLITKRLVRQAPILTITRHTFSVALLIALVVAWYIAGIPEVSLTVWLIILYLGIFTTGVAYLLYSRALKHISAATCVALGLAEPLVAFILAVTLAGEPVNMIAVGGLCFILAGLWLVLRSEADGKLN
ncbi:EamA family transporter [Salmonella enterica subsp. enterica serovar Wedding]|nr:EamA family transporter [Salmonella enterica subsp. enterica serovar Wedding]